jgi:hypothetical protein
MFCTVIRRKHRNALGYEKEYSRSFFLKKYLDEDIAAICNASPITNHTKIVVYSAKIVVCNAKIAELPCPI